VNAPTGAPATPTVGAVSWIDALDAASARAATHPDEALDALPWLVAAIADDREHDRFGDWGRSTVVDENVGAAVLPRPLFEALHARAGLTARWPVGNAGLLHVYGYLLSTTPTPYGLKRERWLSGDLERGYRLADGALRPWSDPDETLLARVGTAATALLARDGAHRERPDGRDAVIALGDPAPDGVVALAYAVDGLLVTTFPVSDPAALRAGLGAPRLRWNAV